MNNIIKAQLDHVVEEKLTSADTLSNTLINPTWDKGRAKQLKGSHTLQFGEEVNV